VLEVVAHVVAAERQHGERVAAHHALGAKGGGGGFAAHGGGHVHAFHPGAGLGDQWHGGGAAATEDEGIDGHAIGSSHCGSSAGLLVAATVKRALGWAALAPVSLAIWGVQSLPCQSIRWSGSLPLVFFHAFPPHVAVVGERHVGENHVLSRLAMQLGLVCMLVPGATPK
jgi:hypothetical protein